MTIQDDTLAPFIIRCTDTSFDLIEVRVYGDKSKQAGTEYEKNIGYYSSLSGALRKAAILKANRSGDKTNLKEYIDRIESFYTKLLKLMP
jgi:hypothetical protein